MHRLSRLVLACAGALAAAAVIPLPSVAQPDGTPMLSDLLKEARQKFAPDRRTAVFDVQIEPHDTFAVVKGEIHSASMKEELLAYIRERTTMTLEDSLMALPQPSVGEQTFAVVSVSVANVRTRPDHPAEMGTQAILGTPLRILKKEHGWYYVQTPDGYLGWTDDRIVLMTAEQFAAWNARSRVIVTAEFSFTRTVDDRTSQVVSDVVAGSILALRGATRTAYEVEYPDGRTAFLRKEEGQPYAEWLAHAGATPETIVATARRFFGIPYLWGGTSAKGMDCSGYTKTVYFLNGILLPRDASQQVHVGELLDTSGGLDLRPGDLLFFGFRATAERKERVTHVAISLGGKRFIHASSDVRINSLDPADSDYSRYREQMFLRAKRIIGAGADTGVRPLTHEPYYGAGHE